MGAHRMLDPGRGSYSYVVVFLGKPLAFGPQFLSS